MHQKWDERYKEPEFAYGKDPNVFFKEWLPAFTPGAILMPADGEGRNGVFAAGLGWQVTSFDLSVEGQAKALQLANEKSVTVKYVVGDMEQLHFEEETFDAIGLVYAHVDAVKKALFHQKINAWLKPGGIIIMEAFNKEHIGCCERDPKVGGPKDIAMLYDKGEILADFSNYEILLLTEEVILLQEGIYHSGEGSVIRFVGKKVLQEGKACEKRKRPSPN